MLSQIGWVIGICGVASALLALLALAGCALWRGSSAAQRHLLLSAVVIASLFLPLGELFSPKVEVEIAAPLPRETVQTALFVPLAVPPAAGTQLAEAPAVFSEPPPVETTSAWSWPAWRMTEVGALLWMLGVALLVIRRLVASVQLHRIRRTSAPVTPEAAEAIAREMGLRRTPPIGTHPRVAIPIVFGVIRPMILLPESAVSWTPQCLRTVLRHEMAHLLRGDLFLQRFIDLAVVVYWFNPILRLAAARIRKEREKACDDLVVARWGNGPDYAENLLEVVRGSRFRIPTGAIGMAASSEIGSRIRRILSATVNRVAPSRPMRVGMSLLCLATVALFGAVRLVEAQSAPEPAAPPVPLKTVRIAVQSADGKPLKGAVIDEVSVASEPPSGLEHFAPMPGASFTTNGQGIAEVSFPEIPGGEGGSITFRARIRHPDYVTDQVKMDLIAPHPIVLSPGYKLELKASRDASVFSEVYADLAGNQYLRTLPWTRAGETISIILSNPQSVRVVAFDADSRPLFSAPMRTEGKPGTEMQKTLEVAPGRNRKGRISANVPRPVKNGRVMALVVTPSAMPGQDGHRWRTYAEVRPDGSFTLHDLPEGALYLIALCDDYVSTTLTGDFSSQWFRGGLVYPSDSSEIEIPMERTGSAEITVSGPDGKPLKGAKVHFLPYQQLKDREDSEALGQLSSTADQFLGQKTPNTGDRYTATTDAEGKVTVHHLPSGILSWSAEADGLQMPFIDRPGEVGSIWTLKMHSGMTAKESVRMEPEDIEGTRKRIEEQRERMWHHPRGKDEQTGEPFPVVPGSALSGRVVDATGRPVKGAEVRYLGIHHVITDGEGRFRSDEIGNPAESPVEFQVLKEGHTPVHVSGQPIGALKAPVVLTDRTFFEGKAVDSQGKPLVHQLIRIRSNTKWISNNYAIPHIWYETHTDADGRYRLFAHPDRYTFIVRTAGYEVAELSDMEIAGDQQRTVDVTTRPGGTLILRMVDSQTGKPVEGMKIQGGFQREMWNAVSDADGRIAIKGMTGDRQHLALDGSEIGYTRWWSEEATSDHERLQFPPEGIQRNFDSLTFNPPAQGEKQVTIYLEKGVRMEGIVRTPDGKPVEGATVTPSVYGNGSPLSPFGHDRRFDATTDKAGRFRLLLPASHPVKIALSAHDGPYSARRTWANGVVGPFITTPGETINRLEIRLTRPAIIRGRVVTPEGLPPKVRQRVSAHGSDGAECIFVHPATYTNEEGYFELKHVRPGPTQVLVGGINSPHEQPGSGNRVTVEANPDQPVEDVKLIFDDTI